MMQSGITLPILIFRFYYSFIQIENCQLCLLLPESLSALQSQRKHISRTFLPFEFKYLCEIETSFAVALQRRSDLCIPRNETVRHRSYIHVSVSNWSAYFAAAK
jgi:hypothetical protein